MLYPRPRLLVNQALFVLCGLVWLSVTREQVVADEVIGSGRRVHVTYAARVQPVASSSRSIVPTFIDAEPVAPNPHPEIDRRTRRPAINEPRVTVSPALSGRMAAREPRSEERRVGKECA